MVEELELEVVAAEEEVVEEQELKVEEVEEVVGQWRYFPERLVKGATQPQGPPGTEALFSFSSLLHFNNFIGWTLSRCGAQPQ